MRHLSMFSVLLLACACQQAPAGQHLSLSPQGGALEQQLSQAAQRAQDQGLTPYAKLGSTWCDPCRELEESLDHPQVKEARRGTLLISLDVDAFQDQLKAQNLQVDAVPALIQLDAQGKGTAHRVEGQGWRAQGPQQIAQSLEQLFHP